MTISFGKMLIFLDGLLRSRNNIKSLYPHYRSTYAHQSWKAVDIPWRASIHDATHPLGFRDYIKNENHFTSTATISIATKFGRMVSYLV